MTRGSVLEYREAVRLRYLRAGKWECQRAPAGGISNLLGIPA